MNRCGGGVKDSRERERERSRGGGGGGGGTYGHVEAGNTDYSCGDIGLLLKIDVVLGQRGAFRQNRGLPGKGDQGSSETSDIGRDRTV